LTAFLGENVSVYHFAAGRTVTDWWVRAAVIQIWTGVLLHLCFLQSIQIYGFSSLSAVSMRSSFLLKGVMLNAAFPVSLMH
ncbi:MAG: hypothetical protein JSW15_08275, partial [Deltaproteobacteria bacterium]